MRFDFNQCHPFELTLVYPLEQNGSCVKNQQNKAFKCTSPNEYNVPITLEPR